MRTHRTLLAVLLAWATAAVIITPTARADQQRPQGPTQQYLVVYQADGAAARAAVNAVGGTVIAENTDVGVATVRSTDPDFLTRAAEQPALAGVARDRAVAHVPDQPSVAAADLTEAAQDDLVPASAAATVPAASPSAAGRPPLEPLQWDYAAIHAAEAAQKGRHGQGVLVGVIDTGVDASHPDIAPNFDAALSRNFTTDIPYDANGNVVDGPCPTPDCKDPANIDRNGHGTHVASVIAASLRGVGMAGIASKATIVSLRAAQTSGYAFAKPTVDALTYAADNGIAVVDMAYYLDPWVFNCPANAADSSEDQIEQRAIITAVQRALTYAHQHGVTLVTAAGAQAQDYTKSFTDALSPDYASTPGEASYPRTITPACKSLPAEGDDVIPVTAVGESGRKAWYSSYGNDYVAVTDPGGDMYDTPDGRIDPTKGVLGAYPKNVAIAKGQLNPDGTPNDPTVVRSCRGTVCGYYQFRQMESEHTAGIAALIIAANGHRDPVHGGLAMDPDAVESILRGTATKMSCPEPRTYTYVRNVLQSDGTYQTVTSTALCEGDQDRNGFFGDGLVNAAAALR
jgi:subtilisin family serine protease